MSGCMETDKPLISILMAVYEPRMDWLREQLESLNAQTYPNLTLCIRDDCSPTVPFEDIRMLVEECITEFPFIISRNETNLGSNQTFEGLTKESEGSLFAYCDQDDVWMPDKLETLQREMERTGALLVCSDVLVIDGNGQVLANSITKLRKRHVFHSGGGLAAGLLYRNFVIGCTMLVRAGTAREALPFLSNMVHDHYLALYCACQGEIQSVWKPLVRYRIHGGNQTAVLSGVKTKKDYFTVRIQTFYRRMAEVRKRFPFLEMGNALEWAGARIAYYQKRPGAGRWLWRLRKQNLTTTLFELIMLRMPECVFFLALNVIKKGFV